MSVADASDGISLTAHFPDVTAAASATVLDVLGGGSGRLRERCAIRGQCCRACPASLTAVITRRRHFHALPRGAIHAHASLTTDIAWPRSSPQVWKLTQGRYRPLAGQPYGRLWRQLAAVGGAAGCQQAAAAAAEGAGGRGGTGGVRRARRRGVGGAWGGRATASRTHVDASGVGSSGCGSSVSILEPRDAPEPRLGASGPARGVGPVAPEAAGPLRT